MRARSVLLCVLGVTATTFSLSAGCGSDGSGGAGTSSATSTTTSSGSGGQGGRAPSVPLEPGSPWPKFRGNAAQDGRSAVHAKTTGGALWSYPTKKGIFSSPVVAADGTVYVGSADRTFNALTPDGKSKWTVMTGEIIDSSALLDDKGRVYFGAGDGKLRALDAKTGAAVWTMDADPPATNKAYINWFEGNVAIGPTGALYVPNDNFFVYAVDRDKGTPNWRFKMPDQTWSLPAVDVKTGTLFIGNNNLLPILGKNTFSIAADGTAQWAESSLGTVAASPVLTDAGLVVLGGFDGYVRAYAAATGDPVWATPTRDHVYASAALLPDGAVVVPSCDGTIYALEAKDGKVRWTFDTREPIRSSPAVDADGNVYVGSGEGKLFVLNADGSLRWSMQLIAADRNDLNSSPALGADAIYLGGESGEVFSVPYDYCLRPMSKGDARCATKAEPFPDGANVVFTTSFGALLSTPPATIDPNQPLTFTLVVKKNGVSDLAIVDAMTLKVDVTPMSAVDVDLSGDGKFLTVSPKPTFQPAGDGTVQIDVHGKYLDHLDRAGLKLSGGTVAGDLAASFKFKLSAPGPSSFPLPIPKMPGDPAAIWEISRIALPLPTIMPSYNQIGFDSLHYLVGVVEGTGSKGVAWMIGAKLEEKQNVAVVDPTTKALLPLALDYDQGALTLANTAGLGVEVMNVVIPFRTFRIAASLGADGTAQGSGARISGSTLCAGVPTYGPFLQMLGLCNPQTDVLSVFGGAYFKAYQGGMQSAPSGLGTASFSKTADTVDVALTGSALKLADHVAGILLVDAATGAPVTLDYGLGTTRTAAPDGTLTSVSVPIKGKTLPASARAYLMIDTYPAAVTTLLFP